MRTDSLHVSLPPPPLLCAYAPVDECVYGVMCVCAQVNWDIPRDTPQTKLVGLVSSVDDLYVRVTPAMV